MTEASGRPRLGVGDVKITLLDQDGNPEEFVLKPSYNAARLLSAKSGGMMKTMQSVVDGDIDAVVQIISLGLGHGTSTSRGPKDLAERVWRTGLSDEAGGLAERAVTYLRVLMAGGRLPATDSGGPAGEGTADP